MSPREINAEANDSSDLVPKRIESDKHPSWASIHATDRRRWKTCANLIIQTATRIYLVNEWHTNDVEMNVGHTSLSLSPSVFSVPVGWVSILYLLFHWLNGCWIRSNLTNANDHRCNRSANRDYPLKKGSIGFKCQVEIENEKDTRIDIVTPEQATFQVRISVSAIRGDNSR